LSYRFYQSKYLWFISKELVQVFKVWSQFATFCDHAIGQVLGSLAFAYLQQEFPEDAAEVKRGVE
jgi:hypothetical protein